MDGWMVGWVAEGWRTYLLAWRSVVGCISGFSQKHDGWMMCL